MKIIKIIKNPYFWLLLIIVLGFFVRLYKIDSPIADWHSWRQADTAAVTRNFIKLGFNPLYPKYDDMSGVSASPIINPSRFRFVEFPVYNSFVYPLYLIFGIDERLHRLVSIFFSLGSSVLIFFITKKYLSTFTSLVAAFCFTFLPFNVFFSRTTLPEPTFIFFGLGMIYFLDQWIERRDSLNGSLGFIFMAIAFLMKPWAIFFFLPLIYSVYKSSNKALWKKFIIFSVVSLLPFILWRFWMQQQPEGIPAAGWLLNSDGIRFRPAFWWWLISERMGREIMGVTGLVLFTIGLITRPKDGIRVANYFLHFWFLSSILFMVIFATGNVRHNYYQTLFVPVASVFMAIGFTHLLKGNSFFVPRIWTIMMALLFFPLSFYFGFHIVGEFYKINNSSMVEVGKIADQLLPKNAIVLAPYNGDTAFLYQINRPGFAVEVFPIEELIADYNVGYYVSTSKDDKADWVSRHFEVLVDKENYIIANLNNIKQPLSNLDPEP